MSNESGIHPKGWRILLRPLEVEDKTESGIIISSKERPILDHHTDERHWDQFLIEVKDNPAPAPKPATIGSLAKSLIKAVK